MTTAQSAGCLPRGLSFIASVHLPNANQFDFLDIKLSLSIKKNKSDFAKPRQTSLGHPEIVRTTESQFRKPQRINTQAWASHTTKARPLLRPAYPLVRGAQQSSLGPLTKRTVTPLFSGSFETQPHPRPRHHQAKLGHFHPQRHCRVTSPRRR